VFPSGIGLDPALASSRDGLISPQVTSGYARRNRVAATLCVLGNRDGNRGVVYRTADADGEPLYVTTCGSLSELPRTWWRTVFAAVGTLAFGGQRPVDNAPVRVSTTPLDLSALDRPASRSNVAVPA
jgi:hypothetical protein